jgi:molybdopterin converting factor small subunit
VKVSLRLPAALRRAGDAHPFVVELAGGTTVADLLDVLAVDRPAAERRIRDERGALRPHVNLFVGEENIRELEGVATPLPDGAELTVIAAISGG